MAVRSPSLPRPEEGRRLAAAVVLALGAWLAAVHLAVPGDQAPGLAGDEAPPAPACVGCHHGADDEAPPPDGGLSAPERTALVGFLAAVGVAAR